LTDAVTQATCKPRSAYPYRQNLLVQGREAARRYYQIKTKEGKEGQLIVKRYLVNEGKIEVVVFTLKTPALPKRTRFPFWPVFSKATAVVALPSA
jgi:hypothetical protein